MIYHRHAAIAPALLAGAGAANEQTTVITREPVQLQTVARLYAVPQSVVTEVPTMRTYKYMVVNHHVVLVDPATSEVVAELAD